MKTYSGGDIIKKKYIIISLAVVLIVICSIIYLLSLNSSDNTYSLLKWNTDPKSPVFYLEFEKSSGIMPKKAANFICKEGLFTGIQFENEKTASDAVNNLKNTIEKKTKINSLKIDNKSLFSFQFNNNTGYIHQNGKYIIMVEIGGTDTKYGKNTIESIINDASFNKIKADLNKIPDINIYADANKNEDKNKRRGKIYDLEETIEPSKETPTGIPTLEKSTAKEPPKNTVEPKTKIKNLGIVSYSEAPKTFTVNIPEDFTKVEAGIYNEENDDTANKYGGWNSNLKVNNKPVWEFVRYDSKKGGIIHDYIEGKEVVESSGKGKCLDITSMVNAGDNKITFYHYTKGSGIGVRIMITY